ncbi:MAG TPA: hypothetical protein VK042_01865 [Atopostipes sp.]|nr:hypothetical protein [Atopostipes sp.]
MGEIIKVSEIKELAETGSKQFEKNTIEGPLFKSIVNEIEVSAIEGYSSWIKILDSTDDLQALKVIRKYLIEAGFTCEFESEERESLVNTYKLWKFSVRW